MDPIQDRFRGALLGTFTGDALGMPLEGAGVVHYAQGEVREMIDARRGRGTYTDDTQLMIALAEGFLDAPGQVDVDAIAARFADAYDPTRGYGGNAHRLLATMQSGVPWRDAVARHLLPGGSYANGAAMRVAPAALAFFGDEEEVADAAIRQCAVTGHGHPAGSFGAELLARGVHRAIVRGARGEAFDAVEFCAAHRPRAIGEFRYALEWIPENLNAELYLAAEVLGTGVRAGESVSMSLWCFAAKENDPEEAIVRSVNVGGDTDTLGAMTGALVGAFHGMDRLPRQWVYLLENGHKGRDYVVELADRLFAVRQPE